MYDLPLELPRELPNNLKHRKIKKLKKNTQMLIFDSEYQAGQPKAKFWHLP